MTAACRDPNCQRYIDDPERRWHAGAWMTEAEIERRRAASARYREENREKNRASHARYYEENRDQIQDKARAGGSWWVTRRKRELGQQRTAVLEQLQELRSHNA